MILWNEIKNLLISINILTRALKSQIKIIRTWRLGGKKIFQQFSETEPSIINFSNSNK
jgi:hypothetical protein